MRGDHEAKNPVLAQECRRNRKKRQSGSQVEHYLEKALAVYRLRDDEEKDERTYQKYRKSNYRERIHRRKNGVWNVNEPHRQEGDEGVPRDFEPRSDVDGECTEEEHRRNDDESVDHVRDWRVIEDTTGDNDDEQAREDPIHWEWSLLVTFVT